MQDILKSLPNIIRAAGSSNLGIVALMLIVLSSLSYAFFRNSREIWRFAALVVLLIGCMSFGVAVFKSATHASAGAGATGNGLAPIIDKWIAEAEAARSAGTISSGSPLPTSLQDTRNQFESAWKHAALAERQSLKAETAWKALSLANRIYRTVESDSSLKPNAMLWADEAIHFCEEIQNRQFLTEALLDKAAIYLDVAQLGNNDKQQFERVARDGDALMTKAYQITSKEQRPAVLRISSRFYYNLARPRSFRLSEEWDNNYLLLAYEKAKAAYELEPSDTKNANQLARSVIKTSKNPPQDADKEWTQRLRDAQRGLKAAWTTSQSQLVGLDQRLSPLDVFGVATLETVAREWRELTPSDRTAKAVTYVAELDADALSPLREAAALLQNSELRKSYGFDLYYDIARAQAVKTAILRTISPPRADKEFSELKINWRTARENAKTSQLEAAGKDVNAEITFAALTRNERKALLDLLSVGVRPASGL